MNGSILRAVERVGLEETYEKRLLKVLAVNRALSRMKSETAYFESNHMFIKTFADVICDFYDHVDVIILRRHPGKVLKSFIELAYFTSRNPSWKGWMNDPAISDDRLRHCFDHPDQIDRIIAYLVSIEEKTQVLRQKHPAVRFHDWRLEDLVTSEGARQLILSLGLEWNSALVKRVEKLKNKRLDRKDFFGASVAEQVCDQRLDQFYESLSRFGLNIPDIRIAWRDGCP
jgi:hypothetical protein